MKPARPELDDTFPHHPHCPACQHDRKLDAAIRHVEGLRGARVRDDTIRLTLANGWYPDWMVDDALAYADEPAVHGATHPAGEYSRISAEHENAVNVTEGGDTLNDTIAAPVTCSDVNEHRNTLTADATHEYSAGA